jgi:hypothetical protein
VDVRVPVAVFVSLSRAVVALELQPAGIVLSFEAKPLDLIAFEVGLKGAILMCPSSLRFPHRRISSVTPCVMKSLNTVISSLIRC